MTTGSELTKNKTNENFRNIIIFTVIWNFCSPGISTFKRLGTQNFSNKHIHSEIFFRRNNSAERNFSKGKNWVFNIFSAGCE